MVAAAASAAAVAAALGDATARSMALERLRLFWSWVGEKPYVLPVGAVGGEGGEVDGGGNHVWSIRVGDSLDPLRVRAMRGIDDRGCAGGVVGLGGGSDVGTRWLMCRLRPIGDDDDETVLHRPSEGHRMPDGPGVSDVGLGANAGSCGDGQHIDAVEHLPGEFGVPQVGTNQDADADGVEFEDPWLRTRAGKTGFAGKENTLVVLANDLSAAVYDVAGVEPAAAGVDDVAAPADDMRVAFTGQLAQKPLGPRSIRGFPVALEHFGQDHEIERAIDGYAGHYSPNQLKVVRRPAVRQIRLKCGDTKWCALDVV